MSGGWVEIEGLWNTLENLGGGGHVLKIHVGDSKNVLEYSTSDMHVNYMAQMHNGGGVATKMFIHSREGGEIFYVFQGGGARFILPSGKISSPRSWLLTAPYFDNQSSQTHISHQSIHNQWHSRQHILLLTFYMVISP